MNVSEVISGVQGDRRFRHELKYLISRSKAEAIDSFVRGYMELDPYSSVHITGRYPISSLYLDSHQYTLFNESKTGKKNRFKLRVRSYSDDASAPVFFEIKRRIDRVILKTRIPITREQIDNSLAGTLPASSIPETENLAQFQMYASRIAATPKILVRYDRKAYAGNQGNQVRITFDSALRYRISDEPSICIQAQDWETTLDNCIILEIKFTGRYPGWLDEMVKTFDLQFRSLSKYTTCLEQSFQRLAIREKRWCG